MLSNLQVGLAPSGYARFHFREAEESLGVLRSSRLSPAFFETPVLGLFPSQMRFSGLRRSRQRGTAAFAEWGALWSRPTRLSVSAKTGYCVDCAGTGLCSEPSDASASPKANAEDPSPGWRRVTSRLAPGLEEIRCPSADRGSPRPPHWTRAAASATVPALPQEA